MPDRRVSRDCMWTVVGRCLCPWAHHRIRIVASMLFSTSAMGTACQQLECARLSAPTGPKTALTHSEAQRSCQSKLPIWLLQPHWQLVMRSGAAGKPLLHRNSTYRQCSNAFLSEGMHSSMSTDVPASSALSRPCIWPCPSSTDATLAIYMLADMVDQCQPYMPNLAGAGPAQMHPAQRGSIHAVHAGPIFCRAEFEQAEGNPSQSIRLARRAGCPQGIASTCVWESSASERAGFTQETLHPMAW